MDTTYTRRDVLKTGTVAGIGASIAGCSQLTGGGGDTLKLGAINPLSGPSAQFGEMVQEVQSAWADQINENGGIDVGGEMLEVEIVEYDDEAKNDQARSAAERLATVDEVSAIISTWRSTGAIAVYPIIQDNEIVTWTGGMTPEVNEPGSHMFRLLPSTAGETWPGMNVIRNEFDDVQNVGLLAEEGDWGDDTQEFMNWWFSENEGDWVDLGRFPFSQEDFSSFITRARSEYENGNIDALYIQTWASAMDQFIMQQHDAGLYEDMPIFTGTGLSDFGSVGSIGAAMEGVHTLLINRRPMAAGQSDAVRETLSDESMEQFEAYEALDAPVSPIGLYAYSEAEITRQAIEMAGSTNSADIREVLTDEEFTIAQGDYEFGDTAQPAASGAYARYTADGDTPVVDDVAWTGSVPPVVNIPPEIDL